MQELSGQTHPVIVDGRNVVEPDVFIDVGLCMWLGDLADLVCVRCFLKNILSANLGLDMRNRKYPVKSS